MHSVWIPKSHFSDNQVRDINEALGKLFGVFRGEEGDKFIFTETILVTILKKIPQIRKWQICATILEEEVFNGKGLTLSKDFIRDKVRNNKDFLKRNGISEEEATNLLEDFVQRFVDRIFKKK